MLSMYWPQKSWLHAMAAGYKLLLLAMTSVLVLPVESVEIMGLVLLISVSLYFTLGSQGWRQLALVKPILWFVVIIMLIHLYTGTWLEGLLASMRLVALFLLACLVTMTTRMQDMLHAIEPIMRPLTIFGLSSRRVALAVALMIRFIPALLHSMQSLQQAWQARGGGRYGRWRLLVPLFIEVLRSSDKVGDALVARGGSESLAVISIKTAQNKNS